MQTKKQKHAAKESFSGTAFAQFLLSQVRKDGEKEEKEKNLLLKACLNGAREHEEHPTLPLAPKEVARDAAIVVAVGTQALYIHPYNSPAKQFLADRDHNLLILQKDSDRQVGYVFRIKNSLHLWSEHLDNRRTVICGQLIYISFVKGRIQKVVLINESRFFYLK